jgi:hypothetical protein
MGVQGMNDRLGLGIDHRLFRFDVATAQFVKQFDRLCKLLVIGDWKAIGYVLEHGGQVLPVLLNPEMVFDQVAYLGNGFCIFADQQAREDFIFLHCVVVSGRRGKEGLYYFRLSAGFVVQAAFANLLRQANQFVQMQMNLLVTGVEDFKRPKFVENWHIDPLVRFVNLYSLGRASPVR